MSPVEAAPQPDEVSPRLNFRVVVIEAGQCHYNPYCTSGKLIDGKCQTRSQATCDGGCTVEDGKCLSPTKTPSCPEQTKYYGTVQKCVHDHDGKCDNGTREGNVCRSKVKPFCEGALELFVGDCIQPERKPGCPLGTIYNNNEECEGAEPDCGPDFHFVKASRRCEADQEVDCGKGFKRWRDGYCHQTSDLFCDKDTELIDGKCVHKKDPECHGDRLEWDPDTKTCITVDHPTCGKDARFNPDTKQCKGRTPACPKHTTLDQEGRCILIRDPPICPEGTELRDTECVAAPICPEGASIRAGKCTVNASWDDGFYAENGIYVARKNPTCGNGTDWDGRRCSIGPTTGCFELRQVCPPISRNLAMVASS